MKIKVLAIDQASNCGWALSNEIYGTWDFNTRKDESSGMKWLRFKSKLKEVCQLEQVDIIAYERVAGFHKSSLIHSAKMVAIIESFCEEHRIQCKAYSATEIKKFATGKGNAGKPLMIKAAQEKYGMVGEDDNQADALHILHLAIEDLKLN